MRKNFLYLSLILILISSIISSDKARAQFPLGEWIFDTTIDPDSNPLEVSGGPVFQGLDTFIVLDQVDLTNLHVYNINRFTRTVESTALIPLNTPAFGLGHVIRKANGNAHSCFIDNFELYATKSPDGVNWSKTPVSEAGNYSDCETAVEGNDIYIGACNFGTDQYRVFRSTDNGQTWGLDTTINGVLCAFEGGTRATFNRIGGENVIFYMTGFNGGDTVVESGDNSTRLVEPGEQVVSKGGDVTVVDMDQEGPPLAESFPFKEVLGFAIAPYYHRESNTIRVVVIDQVGFFPPFTLELGPAPLFTSFFGIICFEGPEGRVNVVTPGRHFQFSVQGNQFEDLVNVPDSPIEDQTDGPVGTSPAPDPFDEDGDGFDDDNDLLIINSIFSIGDSSVYGQFGFGPRPIPTLSEWGLIALSGALMLSGAFYLRRKRAFS